MTTSGDATDALSSGDSWIVLQRTDPEDVQQRQIYVRIDHGPTHTLIFGNVVTLALPPGEHTLKANNTLYWRNVSFRVEPGQTVRFMLINKAGKAAFGFLAVLGVGPLALIIRREDKPLP